MSMTGGELMLGTAISNVGSRLPAGAAAPKSAAKAREAAQEFEAVFLNSMFQQMFEGIDGEGPFGGSGAAGVWRSMLTDEFAKSFAKSGGVGIANEVYRALLAQQEGARS
jgi:peptidoglycan hydrolase FlgJ